jgi:ATP-dependent metalloprotease
MALYSENADPLHKVTIIPRGQALGVTVSLPEGDRVSISKKELFSRLDVCMGGRVAEEIVFGEDSVTTGAHNDLENATEIAKNMVRNYGMNEKFGLSVFGEKAWEGASSQTKSLAEEETNKILKVIIYNALL